MSARDDSDSDAPEEFTAEQVTFWFIAIDLKQQSICFLNQNTYFDSQAIQKDEEIRTIQKENKARYHLHFLNHNYVCLLQILVFEKQ